MAILNCWDVRLPHWKIWKSYRNHAMILGTELNLTSPLRFRVAPSCSSKTCIDVIKSFQSLRPSGLSEQLESTSAMLNLGVSHGIGITRQISSLLLTFQVNLDVTDTRRKNNALDTCEPHSTIKALNDDTYERVQFIQTLHGGHGCCMDSQERNGP